MQTPAKRAGPTPRGVSMFDHQPKVFGNGYLNFWPNPKGFAFPFFFFWGGGGGEGRGLLLMTFYPRSCPSKLHELSFGTRAAIKDSLTGVLCYHPWNEYFMHNIIFSMIKLQMWANVPQTSSPLLIS